MSAQKASTALTEQEQTQAEKQTRYDELNAKFDNDTATTQEITESTRLYAELHPEDKWWDDKRTPAEIWPPHA